MIALDTNILVYAHRREAKEHAAARELLREFAEGIMPWAIPWPCVYEFHSVVTNTRIWRESASTPAEAWQQLDAWFGAPSVRLIGETTDFLQVLRELSVHPRVRGPMIHDARVAAICLANGVDTLYTRDRDYSHFHHLQVFDPFGR